MVDGPSWSAGNGNPKPAFSSQNRGAGCETEVRGHLSSENYSLDQHWGQGGGGMQCLSLAQSPPLGHLPDPHTSVRLQKQIWISGGGVLHHIYIVGSQAEFCFPWGHSSGTFLKAGSPTAHPNSLFVPVSRLAARLKKVFPLPQDQGRSRGREEGRSKRYLEGEPGKGVG